MAGVWPFHWSAFASNQGALNALLLLREFIVHLPLTVDIVTADSSAKNPKRCLLVYHEIYLEVNAMGGIYSHKRMPRALYFDP